MRNEWIGVVVALVLAACTRHDYSICESNNDCSDPSRPICNLNGKCVAAPDAASLCTAGAPISCSSDLPTACGPDGNWTGTEWCPLGCATAEPRCLTFQPSNGLGMALSDAAKQPDVTLPSGARIDTSAGLVVDAAGNPIAVKTTTA